MMALSLFKAPNIIQDVDTPEYYGIFVSAICGLFVNIILLVAFAYESLYGLAAFSISGLIFWSCAIVFVRRGKFTLAVNIGVFEMMFHVGVVVAQIGTIYGGQLILWSAVAYAAFSTRDNTKLTVVMSYLCLFEIALLYAFVPEQTNIQPFVNNINSIFVVLTLSSALPLVTVLLAIKSEQIRQRKVLQFKANHDSLTKLFNRGFFDTLLDYDKNTLATGGGPFCICLADIDHFKVINDTYGHDVGDEVLVEVSKTISENLRRSDAVCRWGGEEFAIILRRCDLHHAPSVIEKIRNEISTTPMSGQQLKVTMSFGLIQANQEESTDALIKRADVLLYQAKSDGRNRVAY